MSKSLISKSLILFCFANVALAQDATTNWDAANKALAGGDAATAQKLYDELWQGGGGGFLLHYNMGAAQYRLGHEAEAIWHFEAALLDNPSSADAAYNLKVAYAHTRDRMPENADFGAPGALRRLGNSHFWSYFMLGCLFLGAIFFLWGKRLMPARFQPYFIYKILAISILTLTSFYFAYLQFQAETAGRYAIIMSDEAPLRSAADDGSTVLTTFHSGTKVFINDKIGDFCKVQLVNGTDGWLLESTIRKIYR